MDKKQLVVNVPLAKPRRKKRKRENHLHAEARVESAESDHAEAVYPSSLAIQRYWRVGYNETTKHLESLAQKSYPHGRIFGTLDLNSIKDTDATCTASTEPLAAVFATRSDRASMIFAHLPSLIRTASLASPSCPRLVSLPQGADERLSMALSVPRVSLLGLVCGNPDADYLVNFLQEHVPEVEAPQFDAVLRGAYLPINLKSVQIGPSHALKDKTHDQVVSKKRKKE